MVTKLLLPGVLKNLASFVGNILILVSFGSLCIEEVIVQLFNFLFVIYRNSYISRINNHFLLSALESWIL